MINKRNVSKFCSEPINLIENYEKAVTDTTETWHCHHRWETDFGYSVEELKEIGKYYGVSASELIFLTNSEHIRLHMLNVTEEHRRRLSEAATGKKMSLEARRKMSERRKGKKPSEETKRKMSEWQMKYNPCKGKTLSGEHKKKISVANSKPILQFTIDGEFVKEYPSLTEAEKQTGLKNLSKCAEGKRKTAHGYKWKYKNG